MLLHYYRTADFLRTQFAGVSVKPITGFLMMHKKSFIW